MQLRSTIVIALAACVLTACADGSNSQDPESDHTPPAIPASPSPPPADGSGVHLPLDAYVPETEQDARILKQANDVLVQRCMASRGFTYVSHPNASAAGPAPDQTHVELYGITDPAVARRLGYSRGKARLANLQNSGDSGSAQGVPNIDQLVAERGTAWVTAMFGAVPPKAPPPGTFQGCIEAGPAALYNSAYGNIDRNIVAELADKATQWTQTDKRVLSVEAAWSRCMADRGFRYPTPMAASQRAWPNPPSKIEVATAVADVACKQQTNLPGIWLAVEIGYQQQLITKNSAALSEFRKDYLSLVKKALQIVSSETPSAHP